MLATALLVLLTSRRLRLAWPYLRFGLYTTALLLVINPLLGRAGADILWQASLGPLHAVVSVQGLYFAGGMAIRLLTVIAAFALYSTLLDQDEQLAIMSSVSFRSGLVVSLATRMFPVLSADASRIYEAQRARGVELDRGSWRRRAGARLPLLGSLATRSLERAVDIAASMETRGYGRRQRRPWRRGRRWTAPDIAVLAAAACALAAAVAAVSTGLGSFTYFPLTDDPFADLLAPSWIALEACLLGSVIARPCRPRLPRAARHGQTAPSARALRAREW